MKFYDITGGEKKFVAGDPQYTREQGSRIFGSSIMLAKPEFDVRKHYMMTIEIARPRHRDHQFWLLGKGAQLQRQGRVLGHGGARQAVAGAKFRRAARPQLTLPLGEG